MLGAFLGDFVGARFEFDPIYNTYFNFYDRNCFTTDDTVCTVALCNAMENCAGGKLNEKTVIDNFVKWCFKYPDYRYGMYFFNWLKSVDKKPYESFGNGALMRLSPVVLMTKKLEDLTYNIDMATQVTHNHPDSMGSSQLYSKLLNFLLVNCQSDTLHEDFWKLVDKEELELFTVESRLMTTHNVKCSYTLQVALSCLKVSSSFEEFMRNVILIGWDTDTVGAVGGPFAEILYGLDFEGIEKMLPLISIKDYPLFLKIIDSYTLSPHFHALDERFNYSTNLANFKMEITLLEKEASRETILETVDETPVSNSDDDWDIIERAEDEIKEPIISTSNHPSFFEKMKDMLKI